MVRKYVGDKMSIEASSRDGRVWDVQFFDHGSLTKMPNVTEAVLVRLVADKRMRPASTGRV